MRLLVVTTLLALGCAGPSQERPGAQPAALTYEEQQLEACRGGDHSACRALVEQELRLSSGRSPLAEEAARVGCDQGHARSCVLLSRVLDRRTPESGLEARERACALGETAECHHIAMSYSLPNTARYQPLRAIAAAELGCRAGDQNLCWAALNADQAVGHSSARVIEMIARLSCQDMRNDDPRCVALVGIALAGGVDQFRRFAAPAQARPMLAEACAVGAPRACRFEAQLWYRGEGGPTDRARAMELLSKTCDAGGADSCFLLGQIHLVRGKGFEPAKAEARFEAACGETRDCLFEAGLRLASKEAWPQAERLLERVCRAGEQVGCGALGRVLVLAKKRSPEALVWLDRACSNGDSAACRAAGELCGRRGPLHDTARARRYAELGGTQPQRLSDVVTSSIARAAKGEGSESDNVITAATVAITAMNGLLLPVLVAFERTPPPVGFGFDALALPEP